ncbi:MAG: AMP-binding protein [Anaerolineae bacterium]|nr:AMP-binding protein [Anaerolineae bacterium]
MTESYNIAEGLSEMAARAPYRPGIIFPAGRDSHGRARTVQLSFQQLNAETDLYAHGLRDAGIENGSRVLLMLHPGVELIATVFALVKIGAAPVLIDPGMGRQAFLRCIADAEPAAMVGIPVAHAMRRLFPKSFGSLRRSVVVGNVPWLGDVTLAALRAAASREYRDAPFAPAPAGPDTEAGIAFTSGSTGVPKGVVYTHGIFQSLLDLLRYHVGIREGEVDLSLLYIFALFNPALGVTTVIPDMDPTKSAQVNPAYVVESIQTHGVTNAFGSPTIWKRVAPYCVERGIRLPSLKRVLMASAPVPPWLVEMLLDKVLEPDAQVNTPFGATEAMPLTWMDGRELLTETAALSAQGRGMCVGRPLPGITLKTIPIRDEAISMWSPSLALPSVVNAPADAGVPAEIGEIVAKGPVVTRTYLNRPDQTALAKIQDEDGVWHRMGDVGYFDAQGRLWFCGRKAHRVTTPQGALFPVPCETIFNIHPDVVRTALVGVGQPGKQRPVLVVEAKPDCFPATALARHKFTLDLLALGAEHAHTREIQTILFYPKTFPTDVRHNVKIQREKLAVWATDMIGERNGEFVETPMRDKVRSWPPVSVLGGLLGVILSLWMLWRRGRRQPRPDAKKG